MTERQKLNYMIRVMKNQIEQLPLSGVHSVLEPYTEGYNSELPEDDALDMMRRHTKILEHNVAALEEQRSKL